MSPDEERDDERGEKPVFEQIFVIEEPPLCGGEIVIHARFTMPDRPSGGGAVEGEAMTRLQIFLPVLRFALEIAGHSQDFDIARQGIVVAGPDTIVGDVLVGLRQDRDNLVLKFRRELRRRSGKHFSRRRRRRDRLV